MGGMYAAVYRFTPAIYILVMFVAVPGMGLALSAVFEKSVVGGVLFLLFLLTIIALFIFLWVRGYPGNGENALCYKVLPKDERLKNAAALDAANATVLGIKSNCVKEAVEV